MTGLELPVRELKNGDVVLFTLMDKKYGRAEFIFCPVWKRRKVVECWITPAQQPAARERYLVRSVHSTGFSIESWTHMALSDPKIWRSVWCRDHKAASLFVYPPDNSNNFLVQVMSDLSITFQREVRS